jgi:hypothetical protein
MVKLTAIQVMVPYGTIIFRGELRAGSSGKRLHLYLSANLVNQVAITQESKLMRNEKE